MNTKKDALEISSTQIHTDLKEIKERISALETIASLANRPTVEAYARTVLTSSAVKAFRLWTITSIKFDSTTFYNQKQMTTGN
jgi:hypothetical protein